MVLKFLYIEDQTHSLGKVQKAGLRFASDCKAVPGKKRSLNKFDATVVNIFSKSMILPKKGLYFPPKDSSWLQSIAGHKFATKIILQYY